jgi:hypothetical protein
MRIAPATPSPVATRPSPPPAPASTARQADASQAPHSAPPVSPQTRAVVALVSPQDVSAAILQRAVGDGDGRTGAAALNDGDAAAQQAKSSVDVRA